MASLCPCLAPIIVASLASSVPRGASHVHSAHSRRIKHGRADPAGCVLKGIAPHVPCIPHLGIRALLLTRALPPKPVQEDTLSPQHQSNLQAAKITIQEKVSAAHGDRLPLALASLLGPFGERTNGSRAHLAKVAHRLHESTILWLLEPMF